MSSVSKTESKGVLEDDDDEMVIPRQGRDRDDDYDESVEEEDEDSEHAKPHNKQSTVSKKSQGKRNTAARKSESIPVEEQPEAERISSRGESVGSETKSAEGIEGVGEVLRGTGGSDDKSLSYKSRSTSQTSDVKSQRKSGESDSGGVMKHFVDQLKQVNNIIEGLIKEMASKPGKNESEKGKTDKNKHEHGKIDTERKPRNICCISLKDKKPKTDENCLVCQLISLQDRIEVLIDKQFGGNSEQIKELKVEQRKLKEQLNILIKKCDSGVVEVDSSKEGDGKTKRDSGNSIKSNKSNGSGAADRRRSSSTKSGNGEGEKKKDDKSRKSVERKRPKGIFGNCMNELVVLVKSMNCMTSPGTFWQKAITPPPSPKPKECCKREYAHMHGDLNGVPVILKLYPSKKKSTGQETEPEPEPYIEEVPSPLPEPEPEPVVEEEEEEEDDEGEEMVEDESSSDEASESTWDDDETEMALEVKEADDQGGMRKRKRKRGSNSLEQNPAEETEIMSQPIYTEAGQRQSPPLVQPQSSREIDDGQSLKSVKPEMYPPKDTRPKSKSSDSGNTQQTVHFLLGENIMQTHENKDYSTYHTRNQQNTNQNSSEHVKDNQRPMSASGNKDKLSNKKSSKQTNIKNSATNLSNSDESYSPKRITIEGLTSDEILSLYNSRNKKIFFNIQLCTENDKVKYELMPTETRRSLNKENEQKIGERDHYESEDDKSFVTSHSLNYNKKQQQKGKQLETHKTKSYSSDISSSNSGNLSRKHSFSSLLQNETNLKRYNLDQTGARQSKSSEMQNNKLDKTIHRQFRRKRRYRKTKTEQHSVEKYEQRVQLNSSIAKYESSVTSLSTCSKFKLMKSESKLKMGYNKSNIQSQINKNNYRFISNNNRKVNRKVNSESSLLDNLNYISASDNYTEDINGNKLDLYTYLYKDVKVDEIKSKKPKPNQSSRSVKQLELFLNMVSQGDKLNDFKNTTIEDDNKNSNENMICTTDKLKRDNESDTSCSYESCFDTCSIDFEDAKSNFEIDCQTALMDLISYNYLEETSLQALLLKEVRKCNKILNLYNNCNSNEFENIVMEIRPDDAYKNDLNDDLLLNYLCKNQLDFTDELDDNNQCLDQFHQNIVCGNVTLLVGGFNNEKTLNDPNESKTNLCDYNENFPPSFNKKSVSILNNLQKDYANPESFQNNLKENTEINETPINKINNKNMVSQDTQTTLSDFLELHNKSTGIDLKKKTKVKNSNSKFKLKNNTFKPQNNSTIKKLQMKNFKTNNIDIGNSMGAVKIDDEDEESYFSVDEYSTVSNNKDNSIGIENRNTIGKEKCRNVFLTNNKPYICNRHKGILKKPSKVLINSTINKSDDNNTNNDNRHQIRDYNSNEDFDVTTSLEDEDINKKTHKKSVKFSVPHKKCNHNINKHMNIKSNKKTSVDTDEDEIFFSNTNKNTNLKSNKNIQVDTSEDEIHFSNINKNMNLKSNTKSPVDTNEKETNFSNINTNMNFKLIKKTSIDKNEDEINCSNINKNTNLKSNKKTPVDTSEDEINFSDINNNTNLKSNQKSPVDTSEDEINFSKNFKKLVEEFEDINKQKDGFKNASILKLNSANKLEVAKKDTAKEDDDTKFDDTDCDEDIHEEIEKTINPNLEKPKLQMYPHSKRYPECLSKQEEVLLRYSQINSTMLESQTLVLDKVERIASQEYLDILPMQNVVSYKSLDPPFSDISSRESISTSFDEIDDDSTCTEQKGYMLKLEMCNTLAYCKPLCMNLKNVIIKDNNVANIPNQINNNKKNNSTTQIPISHSKPHISKSDNKFIKKPSRKKSTILHNYVENKSISKEQLENNFYEYIETIKKHILSVDTSENIVKKVPVEGNMLEVSTLFDISTTTEAVLSITAQENRSKREKNINRFKPSNKNTKRITDNTKKYQHLRSYYEPYVQQNLKTKQLHKHNINKYFAERNFKDPRDNDKMSTINIGFAGLTKNDGFKKTGINVVGKLYNNKSPKTNENEVSNLIRNTTENQAMFPLDYFQNSDNNNNNMSEDLETCHSAGTFFLRNSINSVEIDITKETVERVNKKCVKIHQNFENIRNKPINNVQLLCKPAFTPYVHKDYKHAGKKPQQPIKRKPQVSDEIFSSALKYNQYPRPKSCYEKTRKSINPNIFLRKVSENEKVDENNEQLREVTISKSLNAINLRDDEEKQFELEIKVDLNCKDIMKSEEKSIKSRGDSKKSKDNIKNKKILKFENFSNKGSKSETENLNINNNNIKKNYSYLSVPDAKMLKSKQIKQAEGEEQEKEEDVEDVEEAGELNESKTRIICPARSHMIEDSLSESSFNSTAKLKKELETITGVKSKINATFPSVTKVKSELLKRVCRLDNRSSIIPVYPANECVERDCYGAPLKDPLGISFYNQYGIPIVNIFGCKLYDPNGIPKRGAYGKPIHCSLRSRLHQVLKDKEVQNENPKRNPIFEEDLLNVLNTFNNLKTDLYGRVYDSCGRPLFDQYGYLKYDINGNPLTDAFNRSLQDSNGNPLITQKCCNSTITNFNSYLSEPKRRESANPMQHRSAPTTPKANHKWSRNYDQSPEHMSVPNTSLVRKISFKKQVSFELSNDDEYTPTSEDTDSLSYDDNSYEKR